MERAKELQRLASRMGAVPAPTLTPEECRIVLWLIAQDEKARALPGILRECAKEVVGLLSRVPILACADYIEQELGAGSE